MEYKDLIPETPAEELYAFMRDECGFFRETIITFKAIGHREAEEAYFEDDFVGDFRENRKKRPARCWCSGCERIFLAEYISSKACSGMGIPAGIRMVDAYVAGEENVQDGHSIVCPYCGEAGVLHGASYMRMGHTEQYFLARAYTAQGCVVFVDYIAEQTIHQDRQEIRVEPFEAFVVDGKKVVKLRHWQRYMMGLFRLDDWETNKRFQDTLGCPWFYTRDLPGLEGTSLENAKLWEYMAQTYEKDRFYPVAYARTYLKHPSVENIITSGLGYLVGDGIYQERSAGSQAIPKLGWINWKEKRPSKMLGLNREELRVASKGKWDLRKLEAFKAIRHKLKLEESVEAMKVLEDYQLKEIGGAPEWTGARIMKAVMKQLSLIPGGTKEQEQAVSLHYEIMATAQAAADSLLDLGRKLKQMRDTGGYKHLGFETFGANTEQAVGIRQRQAYNYITVVEKVPARLVEENSAAGVTKLALLGKLGPADQEEVAGQDLAHITVAELQKLIEEKNGLSQQLSMLQEEPAAEAESREVDLEAIREEAREEIRAELEQAHREDLDRQAAEIRKEETRKAAREADKKVRQVKEEALEKIRKAKEAAAKEAESRVEAARESARQEQEARDQAALEAARKEAQEARTQAKETAKRLQLSASEESIRFALLFEQLQTAASGMMDIVDSLQEKGKTEEAEKLKTALGKALQALESEVQ